MAVLTVVWALGRRERRTRFRAAEEQQRLKTSAEESLGLQRQQIARDLHDILSHSMSAMILQSAGAKAVSSKLDSTSEAKQVTEALAAIESTGAESMRELHRLLGLLRTQDGDDASVARLSLADVGPLITATRHGGLMVEVHREGTPQPLDPSVDLAAYHMVQESLTNAMKHAGRGAVVDVYETWEPGELSLQVRSARGLAEGATPTVTTPGSGTGLWGLRERVELAGGSFESGRVEGGFVTSAVLPVRASSSGSGTTTPASTDEPASAAPASSTTAPATTAPPATGTPEAPGPAPTAHPDSGAASTGPSPHRTNGAATAPEEGS
nr:histidine kinase [Ornithinimicrobium sp. F0845]